MAHFSLVFVGVAAAIVLFAGAAVAYLPSITVTQTSQTTQTYQGLGSVGSEKGLVLGAVVNSSVVAPGQPVSIQVWEKNTLDSKNNVSAANGWLVANLATGPCGTLNMPFGFKIFAGYFDKLSANLNSTSGIQYYPPGTYYCPLLLHVGWYQFSPLSTNATLGGFCNPEPCGISLPMNTTVAINGEYVASSKTLTPLAPGIYTVVAGDEWGALLFFYFTVTSAGQNGSAIIPAGTTMTVSSSYDCVAGSTQFQFAAQDASGLSGGFKAGGPGVTLYVATTQQASNLLEGHPSQWEYSSGLQKSVTFSISLPQGSYVIWFEGADLNCGAQLVMPLEMLSQINVTQSFVLTPV